MSSNNPKKITLKCLLFPTKDKQPKIPDKDIETLEVEEAVAMEMGLLTPMIDQSNEPIMDKSTDPSGNITIPVYDVSFAQLCIIISYLQKYLEIKGKPTLNAEFVKNMSGDELKSMAMAANYLEIKYLIDLVNRAIADHIKNKSVEYVRSYFGIDDSEFEKGEEEKLRKMYAWTFEDIDQD